MAQSRRILCLAMTLGALLTVTQLFTSTHSTTTVALRDLLLSLPQQQQQQQQQQQPYRLEYLHIPKTAGTMLEELAGNHNITWGACHFQTFVRQSKANNSETWQTFPPWPSCPPLVHSIEWPLNMSNPWHLPLYLLPHYISFDPFNLNEDERPKRFFTVIRNPYDRIISLYYYTKGWNASVEERNDPKRLNDYILQDIQNTAVPQAQACLHSDKSCHGWFAGARQYDFIHHGKKQVIHHVLHYESLFEDFAVLSAEYKLGFTIQTRPPEKKRRLLTAANLSTEALMFVNDYYKEDFCLGRGYEMLTLSPSKVWDSGSLEQEQAVK